MGKIEVDGIQVQGIENLSERENLSEDKIVLEPETGNAPWIIYEDESLRSEYTKHFRMSDGTFMAAIYEAPVHYFDDVDKKYKVIESGFTKEGEMYIANKGKFTVELSRDGTKTKILRIKKSNEEIRLGNVSLASTYSADFHLLATQEFKIGSVSRTYSYQYDSAPDHRITGIELPTGDSVRIKYDNLGRTSGHDTRISTGDMILDETITYLTVAQSSGGTRNTNYVASIKYYQRQGNVYETHGFNYDDNGNISSISVGGVQKRSYQYDGLNRLTRENNAAFNKSVAYEYDAGGNITKKTEYGYTTSAAPSGGVTKTYVYDATNKDRLTSYNGETIGEYDAQGNPWIYRGNALVWERRSALARYGSNTFTYKDDGVRVTKNGIKYFYDGQRLLKEEHADYSLWFYYDDRGVAGFTKSASADLITAQEKNNSTYVFRRNLQGDITHVYNTQGYLYARYEYNAWGEHKIYNANGVEITSGSAYASEIGRINPFRYRSYYYDEETKLYYLMTRYYDPEVGRFISQDNIAYLDPETLGGLNLYAYCGNNPVMGTDPEGTWDWRKFLGWVVDAVIAVAAVAAITVVVVGTVASSGLLGAVLVGAGAGALVAMGGSVVAQGGFSTSDPWQVAKAGGIGAAIGAASGATSWTLGTIGESLGAQLGYAFSNTTHLSSGVKFGKVFSTEFLMSAGKTIGGISGGFIGGAGMNYVLNEGMGNSLNADEAIGQGFMGESPLWMIRFFRWLCV